jgi:peptidoglycan/xylan/chitin deacetylase (PgdA/CDA1 family)
VRRLTLTFDNGPAPGITERVLDVLADRGLTATFFMIGAKAATPEGWETAQRVAGAGHRIGNHTLNHGDPLGARDEPGRAATEIGGADEILRPLLGSPPLFRPNGRGRTGPHLLNREAIAYLVAQRYTVVAWNAVPRDYEPPPGAWVDRALSAIDSQPRTLLVLHDHVATTPDALPGFLDEIARRGVELSTSFPPACIGIDAGRIKPALRDSVLATPSP